VFVAGTGAAELKLGNFPAVAFEGDEDVEVLGGWQFVRLTS
jgi:hypothetical protein